jgi:hypothetical protein
MVCIPFATLCKIFYVIIYVKEICLFFFSKKQEEDAETNDEGPGTSGQQRVRPPGHPRNFRVSPWFQDQGNNSKFLRRH